MGSHRLNRAETFRRWRSRVQGPGSAGRPLQLRHLQQALRHAALSSSSTSRARTRTPRRRRKLTAAKHCPDPACGVLLCLINATDACGRNHMYNHFMSASGRNSGSHDPLMRQSGGATAMSQVPRRRPAVSRGRAHQGACSRPAKTRPQPNTPGREPQRHRSRCHCRGPPGHAGQRRRDPPG